MRFVVDAQLPPTLTQYLSSLGHEAEHVTNIGLASASDGVIWQHAFEAGAAIITKDEDFLTVRSVRPDGPAVVWVRVGNTTRDALMRVMRSALPKIIAALEAGETVVEISG